MKLENREQKLAFLNELYAEIERINAKNYSKKDEGFETPIEKTPHHSLPEYNVLNIPNTGTTLKSAKLDILVDIYNTVLEKVAGSFDEENGEEEVKLNDIFQAFKDEGNRYVVEQQELSAEDVLRTHRNEREASFWNTLGNGWLAKLIAFFLTPQPKSQKFLDKHGFFGTPASKIEESQPEHQNNLNNLI